MTLRNWRNGVEKLSSLIWRTYRYSCTMVIENMDDQMGIFIYELYITLKFYILVCYRTMYIVIISYILIF